ncbi:MAG TPA: GGDEF domain-containing protein [Actinomycetes bacterium]|nr:GGDEF domain-containing protein [Actinomycetes bacterium]
MSDDKPTVTLSGSSGAPEFDDALHEDAVRSTLPVLGGLSSVTMLALGVVAAVQDLPIGPVVGLGVATGLLVALTVVSWLWRHTLPMPEVAAVAMVLIPAGGGVLGVVISDDMTWSLAVVVALALVGTSVLTTRWVVAAVYTIWVGWLAGIAAADLPEWPVGWLGAGAVVTAAGVMATVSRRRMTERLAELAATAAQASVRDPLTGLVNRKGLSMMGQQIVETARRSGDAVHCVYVDIDQLRHVNEVMGSEAGDEVVVAIADALRSVTRATDIVARWGGDEFCVIGPGPGMSPMELERRLRERVLLSPPVPVDVWEPKVCAGGAMLAPWDSGTLDTLLGKADQEMYLRRALRRGGPRPRRASSASEEEQQPN